MIRNEVKISMKKKYSACLYFKLLKSHRHMQFDVNIRLYEYWHEQVKIRKKRWNNKEIKKFYWKEICKQKVRKRGVFKADGPLPRLLHRMILCMISVHVFITNNSSEINSFLYGKYKCMCTTDKAWIVFYSHIASTCVNILKTNVFEWKYCKLKPYRYM
jgi:hypothetical protein